MLNLIELVPDQVDHPSFLLRVKNVKRDDPVIFSLVVSLEPESCAFVMNDSERANPLVDDWIEIEFRVKVPH